MRTGTLPGVHPWMRMTRAAAAPLIPMVIAACAAGGMGLSGSLSDVQVEALEREGMAFLTALDAEDAYVAISPDGRRIATASGTISGMAVGALKLWDAGTGELVATLEAPAEGIGAVAFANDGRVVAAGGLDGLVRVFDAGSGELTATLAGHSNFVLALAFSPDGVTLASASGSDPRPVRLEAGGDNEIILWDLGTGARRATWELGGLGLGRTDFYSIAFSPDGAWLASGSGTLDQGGGIRGLLVLWDVDTGTPRPVFLDPPGAVLAVAFSPDGTRLAAGGFTRVVRIWNVDVIREAPASAPVPPSSALSASQLRNWVYDLAFTVDGRTLVAASGDPTQPTGAGQIRLWDVDSGEPLGGKEPDRGVKSLALSPDASMLVAGLIGGDARVYRLRQP